MVNFPPWATTIRSYLPIILGGGAVYLVVLVWYGGSPLTTDVGYAPVQPVPYSHALHAGELGIDCRYCHTHVEQAAHANVPNTETCMNCHQRIKAKSPQLAAVRESWATQTPVNWVRIHDLPDFVYFNHSAHVSRGVGCVSCHGRIDTMERVYQAEKLSMGWCLDCHRNPGPHLRPQASIYDTAWKPSDDPTTDPLARARGYVAHYHIDAAHLSDCTVCHR